MGARRAVMWGGTKGPIAVGIHGGRREGADREGGGSGKERQRARPARTATHLTFSWGSVA
jgi:hypothetical protein